MDVPRWRLGFQRMPAWTVVLDENDWRGSGAGFGQQDRDIRKDLILQVRRHKRYQTNLNVDHGQRCFH